MGIQQNDYEFMSLTKALKDEKQRQFIGKFAHNLQILKKTQ
jgi:hypothetical protein